MESERGDPAILTIVIDRLGRRGNISDTNPGSSRPDRHEVINLVPDAGRAANRRSTLVPFGPTLVDQPGILREGIMILEASSRQASLWFTTASALLGLASILLGKRVNYLDHLQVFNLLAAAMLALVVVGLVAAMVSLVKVRGRSASSWLAAAFAILVLGSYLLDR